MLEVDSVNMEKAQKVNSLQQRHLGRTLHELESRRSYELKVFTTESRTFAAYQQRMNR